MDGVQASESIHPYIPKDLILPYYVPIMLPLSTVVSVYGCASFIVISVVWILAGRLPKLSKLDKVLMCWWVFTGLTHTILDWYFTFTPEFFKQKNPTYLAEVWKEYSKGDSRFVARHSAVVALEGMTAVLGGPASLLSAYAIATRKSYSHLLQMATALGQIYGTTLYFITAYLEGNNFAASLFYYYAYYINMNSFWLLVSSLIFIRSWKKICEVVCIEEQNKTKTR